MLSKVQQRLPAIGFDRFKAVINEVVRHGKHDKLILSGGEVTTFNELGRYVQFAASLGWFRKIQIQTNGRRLSDKKYLEHLVRCGVNEFFVSVQGMEQSHEATTRVPGSFSETLAGLRNLGDCGANVISNTVLTKQNVNEIVSLFAILGKELVSEMQLWNFFPMDSTDRNDTIVDLPSFSSIIPGLLSVAADVGKPVVLKSFPQCLSVEPPLFLDSLFPVTVLPDLFWKQFQKSGFGQCFYRKAGLCKSWQCWGLSSAYIEKYGDTRGLLRPIGNREP